VARIDARARKTVGTGEGGTDTQVEREAAQSGTRVKAEQAQQFGSVFWVTVAISVAFVLWGVLFTDNFTSTLQTIVGGITSGLGWLYMLITTFFLVFVVYLAFSRYGKIKLGQPDDEPEYGNFAWFAMLFQAGMGIGLVFWGVAEPLTHYNTPPLGLAEAGTPEAANLALQTAFFHWTLHPWAMYATVGLAVAYFSFRRGMANLQISTVFYPLLGERVNGPLGKVIDVLAIIATLFGVAVSLGLGTLQITAGLNVVFGLPNGLGTLMIIIAVTAVAYMLSASTPVDKGVNFLSQASMYLAMFLLVYFLVVGPTLLQLNTFTEVLGLYLANLVPQSLRLSAFDPDPWLGQWTLFFWATWIAWAPYVGAFIARISKGRTVRGFIIGVLVGPSLFSMIWFSVFGAAAIDLDQNLGGTLGETVTDAGPAVALFEFLAEYPFPIVTSLLAIFLVWIFFVAGADAGVIVLGSMSSGGVLNPKRVIKLTWGVIMAALAAILLLVGGGGSDALDGLTNGAILAATPFGILMVPMCYGLYKTLKSDYREERREMQEAMAYDRNVERRQLEEIKTGPRRVRRVRVSQTPTDRPTPNESE
jgi:glycine betaine transporter